MNSKMIDLLASLRNEKVVTDLQVRGNGKFYARRGGRYHPLETSVDAEAFVDELTAQLDKGERLTFDTTKSVTTRVAHESVGVLRSHFFKSLGRTLLAMRFLEADPWRLEDLRLPQAVAQFADLGSGLVLFTGLPGSGKSTTMHAVLRRSYEVYPGQHISTIDRPLEYLHRPDESTGTIVTQREVGTLKDAPTFGLALQSVLRSDSTVFAVGELFDDEETIPAAVEAAATGMLVFATIHAPSVGDALERLIAAFPPDREKMLRMMLSRAFRGGVSLRLLPGVVQDTVEPACELLLQHTAVQSHIENGTVQYLRDIEATEPNMQTLEWDLNRLVASDRIERSEALRSAVRKDEIK